MDVQRFLRLPRKAEGRAVVITEATEVEWVGLQIWEGRYKFWQEGKFRIPIMLTLSSSIPREVTGRARHEEAALELSCQSFRSLSGNEGKDT